MLLLLSVFSNHFCTFTSSDKYWDNFCHFLKKEKQNCTRVFSVNLINIRFNFGKTDLFPMLYLIIHKIQFHIDSKLLSPFAEFYFFIQYLSIYCGILYLWNNIVYNLLLWMQSFSLLQLLKSYYYIRKLYLIIL